MIHLGEYGGPSPRTYKDLIKMGRPWEGGTCCSCHRWSNDMPKGKQKLFHISTRANICMECCERKGDEVLGPIKRAETKARHYVRELIKRKGDIDKDAPFYARLSRVSEEFFRKTYEEQRK